eukprot:TRINITY_DN3328_c0_g1_i1.p1 TRINITY_DN3328_c0_g1~~TRINITY_DN3328_c0_g1_i1.p1  ORF type:complete len:227 (+),score=62.10 TRINITY_DN3328_c0_g1_i1:31-711(+)
MVDPNIKHNMSEVVVPDQFNMDGFDLDRVFIVAASEGNLKVVKQCIKAGVYVDTKGIDEWTALCKAVEGEHEGVVEFLVDFNADVNLGLSNDLFPLYIGCKQRNAKIVEFLLQRGARAERYVNNKEYPLLISCVNNDYDIAHLLCRYGADPSGAYLEKVTPPEKTPFYVCCEMGHLNIARMLLNYKPSMIDVCHNGISPLDISSQNGHLDIVEMILNYHTIVPENT